MQGTLPTTEIVPAPAIVIRETEKANRFEVWASNVYAGQVFELSDTFVARAPRGADGFEPDDATFSSLDDAAAFLAGRITRRPSTWMRATCSPRPASPRSLPASHQMMSQPHRRRLHGRPCRPCHPRRSRPVPASVLMKSMSTSLPSRASRAATSPAARATHRAVFPGGARWRSRV